MLKSRRTGGSAAYPPVGSDYTYMNSGLSSQSTSQANAPALKGGACSSCNSGGGRRRRYGGYFVEEQKQANNDPTSDDVMEGGGRRRRGGSSVELTAFISALALLGARLLADKNSSFNLFSSNQRREEQVGGVRRRGGRPTSCRN
jgi:hypothetical protein